MNDEFYIGWEPCAPAGIARNVRWTVVILLLSVLAVSITLAVSQRMIGRSAFEWGGIKSFKGIFQAQPYPHLLVKRPANVGDHPEFSAYYLVAQWKFGLDPARVRQFDGKTVQLKGTLIYRGSQTMIETKPEWIQAVSNSTPSGLPGTLSLGRQTLVGEIVDSKCFLGVMNPGQLTPHRACAIRCISGGVPPIFVVQKKGGPLIYFLLVSSNSRPINQDILDLVAQPVEITGEVEKQGELFVLRADPATCHRLK